MTRRDLALSLLRDAGPRGVTTAEFLQSGVGSRYSARVRELRQAGHLITSERVREGSWRYVLSDAEVGGGDGSARGLATTGSRQTVTSQSLGAPSDPTADLSARPKRVREGGNTGMGRTRLFDPPSRYDDLVKKSA